MRLPTLHTILLLASLLTSLCFWPPSPVNAEESSVTYQLPQYDYTIRLPKAWDVLPPASRDSALTIQRTAATEGFLIYARYHFAVHLHQPYADLISTGMPAQMITLHNGARALQFHDNTCQTVVWIYHAIERFVSGCGLDAQQATIFAAISRSMDAPSYHTGQGVIPPANPRIDATMQRFLDTLATAQPGFVQGRTWTAAAHRIQFPNSWTVGTDEANGLCTVRECIRYAARPTTGSTERLTNVVTTTVWVGLDEIRLDYDQDPYGYYLFDPSYYGRKIRLADGRLALVFARQEAAYREYTVVMVERTRYTLVIARLGTDPSTGAFRSTIMAILKSLHTVATAP